MIDLKLIAERLTQARNLQSLGMAEVSAGTGISVEHLSLIEGGNTPPSGDELLILANFYVRDFRDFIDPARPEPFKETNILYRRYGDAFTPEDRRAIQEFLFLCEVEATLKKELTHSYTEFHYQPRGSFYNAHGEDAAAELRRLLGYGQRQINLDIYDDFRKIGFHIFRRKLANTDISGLYIEHPIAGHCILVNYEEDIYRQRFSVSHEAAHAIFDSSDAASVSYKRSSSKYDHKDLKEVRANRFASCYLMPPELLPHISQWNATLAVDWAKKLKVSTEALSYALLKAERVDEETAKIIRSVRVAMSDKVDPEAPEHLSERQLERRLELLQRGLSDVYVGLCFEAHQCGLISAGRLAEVLLADHRQVREISELYGRAITREL
ncbi:helix-turn-helix domain-containing protein [Pseudomonas syringae]|uniref:helix-turn-helix domain-containing protein n=1 Tax=Pseudomonas syringae TaxID=317 RepID=UPI001C4F2A73|nr:XRE family transcriptional regulator [Pseudomonas syringae]